LPPSALRRQPLQLGDRAHLHLAHDAGAVVLDGLGAVIRMSIEKSLQYGEKGWGLIALLTPR